jgi:hypothetical protein
LSLLVESMDVELCIRIDKRSAATLIRSSAGFQWKLTTGPNIIIIVIMHLLGLALAGCLASRDTRPYGGETSQAPGYRVTGNKVTAVSLNSADLETARNLRGGKDYDSGFGRATICRTRILLPCPVVTRAPPATRSSWVLFDLLRVLIGWEPSGRLANWPISLSLFRDSSFLELLRHCYPFLILHSWAGWP